MPIGWITVLKLVPWGDVIKNAPVIADGAKKLWDTVGRKPDTATATATPKAAARSDVLADPAGAVSALQVRVAETEAALDLLHEQMQASTQLIKALAEQNTELVKRVELNRSRTAWLMWLLVVFGAIAALNLVVTFSRAS